MKKYKQVLILLNIINREKLIAEITADLLKKNGLAEEVVIGQAYEVIFHIYDYEPELVISCLPRDEYSTAMFTMVKLVHRCAWVCIHPEGFQHLDDEVINEVVGENRTPARLIDKALFWGSGMAEVVREKLLVRGKLTSADRTGVFGYLPYERSMLAGLPRPPIVEEAAALAEKHKKTVIFVTPNISDVIGDHWPEAEKKRGRSNIYYFSRYKELIGRLAKDNRDVLFLVKRHPGEIAQSKEDRFAELRGEENICIIDDVTQISFFFDHVDLFVHYGSTTAFEAYIYHIPAIGILNDHEEKQVNSLGSGDMYADVKFSLGESSELEGYINREIRWERNAETEHALRIYMNYTPDTEYRPSEQLVACLSDIGEPQLLAHDDPDVVHALHYKSVVKRRVVFRLRMIRDLLTGDRERGRRIRMWLKRYKDAVRGRERSTQEGRK